MWRRKYSDSGFVHIKIIHGGLETNGLVRKRRQISLLILCNLSELTSIPPEIIGKHMVF